MTDGTVLPFSTVDCDKVRSSIATAVWGGARAQAALLMGRALGRIAAHEIFHIFTHSGSHTKHGVTRPSLTAAELIADKTTLEFEDLHKLDPKN